MLNAYQRTSDIAKSPRERERDVLALVTRRLRSALANPKDLVEVARAVSDNLSMWYVLITDLSNDENKLPLELRASLISIGMAVVRECERPKHKDIDLKFLIDVNQNLADGLADAAAAAPAPNPDAVPTSLNTMS